MIDHISLNVKDYRKSLEFYKKALAPIGIELLMEPIPQVGGFGRDQKPFFWIGGDKKPVHSDVHVAFTVNKRSLVDKFYEAAMKAGGKDNGKPGIREIYHPNYYGAFVLDPDGNNIEAVCHLQE